MSNNNDIIMASKNTYFRNFKMDIFSSSGEDFQWEKFVGDQNLNFIFQQSTFRLGQWNSAEGEKVRFTSQKRTDLSSFGIPKLYKCVLVPQQPFVFWNKTKGSKKRVSLGYLTLRYLKAATMDIVQR